MQITVTTETGGVFPLEVSLELTLMDLKAILEIEVACSAAQMVLFHNMNPMTEEEKSLGDYRVQEGDIIMLTSPLPPSSSPTSPPPSLLQSDDQEAESSLPAINWGVIQVPGPSHGHTNPSLAAPPPSLQADPNDPEEVRRHFISHPTELAMLRQQNPPLAQALESGDAELFRQVLERQVQELRDSERERIRMLNADPLDPDNQNRIAQDIQQRNIEENMQTAIEYTPESFSNIVMLYVLIKVNGVPVKALVDSGAAGTIMSNTCAETCGIMRLVDRRFAGMAIGVGTQKIIGKVHLGTIQIGEDFLTSSFKVLENQSEDMLLGLDMLRRHQCSIDLNRNVLCIGTTGNETPFLTEAELKDKEETRLKQVQQILEGEDAEVARVMARSELEQQAQLHGSASTQSQNTASLPGPSHQSVQGSGTSGGVVSESSIQRIIAAGFSREEAIAELQKTGGTWQLAITSLLAKSITVPPKK